MDKLTHQDIEALREYLDKVDEINQEAPQTLTAKEWEEALREIKKTGKIPAKYEGRISENEETVYDDVINGKYIAFPEGKKKKTYYDTAQAEFEKKQSKLLLQYKDYIVKAIQSSEDESPGSVRELLEKAVKPKQPVLDVSNLPNALITDKNLQYALTPLRNNHAYIMPLDYEQLSFDYDENGEIIIRNQAQYNALEKAKDKETKISAAGIDQPLLRQLFAATMKAYLSNYGDSITVSLPAFAREMNIDISSANKKAEARSTGNKDKEPKHNANDFFKKLEELEKLNGIWEQGSFYRVFLLKGYNAKENTIEFSSPWLFKIVKELLDKPAVEKKKADGSLMWEITGISGLMKSSISSARSKPTVEIIATLIAGLKQYGTTPEAKRHPGRNYKDKNLVEYRISFKTLIERIPLITENLDSCKPSNKTTLLQRYFCGYNFKKRQQQGKGYILEEYIAKYTYLKEYYKDFEISFTPPTVKTLSEKITIRQHGINTDFKTSNGITELLQTKKSKKK